VVVDRRRAAVEHEQRLSGGDKIPHLWHELDDALVALRQCHQRREIDSEHDFRRTFVLHFAIWRLGPFVKRNSLERQCGSRIGIHGFDHRDTLVADVGDDRDRSQQTRRVVDQEQEVGDACDPENPGEQRDEARSPQLPAG
jgi:hypothetical protein